jgi:hypothetical protein
MSENGETVACSDCGWFSAVRLCERHRAGGAVWTAQVNDLVGGAIVTTVPHPLSRHDFRPDGDDAMRGYVIAECMSMADADAIADLLNAAGITRALSLNGGTSPDA